MTSPTLITQPSRIDSSRGRENKTCATCHWFTTKDDPEQAKHGIGACKGYDEPVQPFVAWDNKFCVLYRRAADPQGHRVAFVQRQIQRQGEGECSAQAN